MREEELLIRLQREDKNTSFDILNTSSCTNILYRLNAPFQITYECCSGTDACDYLNILTLSPNGISYAQESTELHNYVYQHKAPHIHDYYEFIIILKGSIYQQIEGREYLYSEGACCLINRNLRHKEIFREASRVLFVGFSSEYMTALLQERGSFCSSWETGMLETALYQFITDDMKSPGRKAYLDFLPAYQNRSYPKQLHRISEQLIHTMMFPQFGSSHITKGLLCYLLGYLALPSSYHCSVMELDNSNDYLLFSRIEHLLEENNGRISRQELSKALNYSGDYLNRIIHKYTGMSLHRYGMKLCMKKAAHALITTTDTISSIASELSFSNRTYFYRLFEEFYGMSPNEYRKKRVYVDLNNGVTFLETSPTENGASP